MTATELVAPLAATLAGRPMAEVLAGLGESADGDRWMRLRSWVPLLGLRRTATGTYHEGNWWRGPLLYSLITHYRPRHVLELGTGRGYSAACMAQAVEDAQLDCTIWTVDWLPAGHPQAWDLDEGHGPRTEPLSRQEAWRRYLPPPLQRHLRCLTGESRAVLASWARQGRPPVGLCFIDGAHDYWGVKGDFLGAMSIASPGCAVLFDDYTERKYYGVKQLLDAEVLPRLPAGAAEIIDTGQRVQTVFGEDVPHGMVLIRGEGLTDAVLEVFRREGRARCFRAAAAAHRALRRTDAAARRLARRLVGRRHDP